MELPKWWPLPVGALVVYLLVRKDAAAAPAATNVYPSSSSSSGGGGSDGSSGAGAVGYLDPGYGVSAPLPVGVTMPTPDPAPPQLASEARRVAIPVGQVGTSIPGYTGSGPVPQAIPPAPSAPPSLPPAPTVAPSAPWPQEDPNFAPGYSTAVKQYPQATAHMAPTGWIGPNAPGSKDYTPPPPLPPAPPPVPSTPINNAAFIQGATVHTASANLFGGVAKIPNLPTAAPSSGLFAPVQSGTAKVNGSLSSLYGTLATLAAPPATKTSVPALLTKPKF